MKFSVILRSSLYSLKKNARRTFLTMLGIIIGIASVITIMSLGNGYSRHSVETLTKDEQGRQNVDFFYEMTSEVDVPNFSPFSDKTMEKLNEIDGVSEAAESQYEADNQPYYEIKAREHSESLAVDVAAKNYDRTMVAGRMLTLDEQKTFLPYAVIDDELARKMYGTEENALNKGVKINNYSFTIIGVGVMYSQRRAKNWRHRRAMPLFRLEHMNNSLKKKCHGLELRFISNRVGIRKKFLNELNLLWMNSDQGLNMEPTHLLTIVRLCVRSVSSCRQPLTLYPV